MLNKLIAALVLLASSVAYADDQIDYTFYRNPQTPITGTANGAAFAFPGNALTASTFRIRADLLNNRPVKSALWVIAWNPNTGSSPTVVRIVKGDDGPTNIVELGRVSATNYNTPRVDQVDITSQLQTIMADGLKKHLMQQTAGNGSNGPLIYASWIEIIWGD